MSYNPLIEIKTKYDKEILSCEFSARTLESFEIWHVLENLVQQGLATYLEGSRSDCYPSVIDIPQATEPVKSVLIPAIEKILFMYAKTVEHFRGELNIATMKEDKQEQERWENALKKREKENIETLESLKSLSGEGLIIELWGIL